MADIDLSTYIPSLGFSESNASGQIVDLTPEVGYLHLKISDLPELGEGDFADFRRVLFALESAIYDAYQALDAADKPTKWICQRATTLNDSTDVITRTFIHQFNTETTGEEVADEPA